MNQIVIVVAAALIIALPAAVLVRWLKQRKDHQEWLRLTDGQEATEL